MTYEYSVVVWFENDTPVETDKQVQAALRAAGIEYIETDLNLL